MGISGSISSQSRSSTRRCCSVFATNRDDQASATEDHVATHQVLRPGLNPYNELLYRDMMRLQARLRRLDAIPRTLTLLTTRLAELDEHPSPHTVQLAQHLSRRIDPPASSTP